MRSWTLLSLYLTVFLPILGKLMFQLIRVRNAYLNATATVNIKRDYDS